MLVLKPPYLPDKLAELRNRFGILLALGVCQSESIFRRQIMMMIPCSLHRLVLHAYSVPSRLEKSSDPEDFRRTGHSRN